MQEMLPESTKDRCKRVDRLDEVARMAGVTGKLEAPEIVSIDVLDRLPGVLREENLYVARLGQWHGDEKGATFIICRASPGTGTRP